MKKKNKKSSEQSVKEDGVLSLDKFKAEFAKLSLERHGREIDETFWDSSEGVAILSAFEQGEKLSGYNKKNLDNMVKKIGVSTIDRLKSEFAEHALEHGKEINFTFWDSANGIMLEFMFKQIERIEGNNEPQNQHDEDFDKLLKKYKIENDQKQDVDIESLVDGIKRKVKEME